MFTFKKTFPYFVFTFKKTCPYCIGRVCFYLEEEEYQTANSSLVQRKLIYRCPDCKQPVERKYVEDYHKSPPIFLNAIGWVNHGKSFYFASLFQALRSSSLFEAWQDFSWMPADDDTLKNVREAADRLARGIPPEKTTKMFPRPMMFYLYGVPVPNFLGRPKPRRCTLLVYDTSGESYRTIDELTQFAFFVKRASTALMFVSLLDPEGCDWKESGLKMHEMLSVYIAGMSSLGGITQKQRLVVTFTKGDELAKKSRLPQDLETYLKEGHTSDLARIYDHCAERVTAPAGPYKSVSPLHDDFSAPNSSPCYFEKMAQVSDSLRNWCDAANFVQLAGKSNFQDVRFSIVSSKGFDFAKNDAVSAEPIAMEPLRLFDPLLWVFHKSLQSRLASVVNTVDANWKSLLSRWLPR